MNKDEGGVTIGTNNVSKVNSTTLLYVDGYAYSLGWNVISDRN